MNNIAAGGVYVSLHTADEGNEPDGSNEVGAADYSRVQLAEADIGISGSAPTTMANNVSIDWGTTSNDWGTITHAALWTGAQGTTGVAPETATIALTNSGSAPAGVSVSIPAGELTFEMD